MTDWRAAWRAFAAAMPRAGLEALRQAILANDPRLVQGATTEPVPLSCTAEDPVTAACAVGYAWWQGAGLTRVGQVEERFCAACSEADLILGQRGECRYFLNWFDETPREEALRELLPEIEAELRQRGEQETWTAGRVEAPG